MKWKNQEIDKTITIFLLSFLFGLQGKERYSKYVNTNQFYIPRHNEDIQFCIFSIYYLVKSRFKHSNKLS